MSTLSDAVSLTLSMVHLTESPSLRHGIMTVKSAIIMRYWSENTYVPYRCAWPDPVDTETILDQINDFFRVRELRKWWDEYLHLARAKKHSEILGERKTLNREEAFILFVMMKHYKPRSIIEIGALLGRSTRRIIDIKKYLKLDAKITCFDIVNKVKFFSPAEARLCLRDLTDSFSEVIETHPSGGLIYLDAHPYDLTYNVTRLAMQSGKWLVTVHDCASFLCNPNMKIGKNDPVTSLTGHWERYVLASIFNINDPLDEVLDQQMTQSHRMRIFNTLHGICAIVPK